MASRTKAKKPKENKTLFYSGIAGIFLVILAVPMTVLTIMGMLHGRDPDLIPLSAAVYFLILIFSVIFMWGFKVIAEKTKNNFLKNMAYVALISAVLLYSISILDLFFPFINKLLAIALLVIGGIISILFAKGLLPLKKEFGGIVTAAALLEIISGICSITIILSSILYFLNFILLFPMGILETIILFKASEKF